MVIRTLLTSATVFEEMQMEPKCGKLKNKWQYKFSCDFYVSSLEWKPGE